MSVFLLHILQLGLHVHAVVNQEEYRQTVGKHWHDLRAFMHSHTTEADGRATEQPAHQTQTAEVHVGNILTRQAFITLVVT